MPLDPQFQAVLPFLAAIPKLSELPLDVLRSMPTPPNPNPTPVADVSERRIPGPDGEIPLRIYRARPNEKRPLLLFYHGGGFVAGGLDSHDEMARVLAAETGYVTVSVDYRLAPENPFPAAPDDSFAALKWAVAHASELGANASLVATAGDSAGGNLSAVMALKARDEGGPALKAHVMIYPAVDQNAALTPPPDGDYILITPQEKAFYHRSYVPEAWMAEHIYASPLNADLKNLPPALLICAEYDPLLGQDEAYAKKLEQSGVDTTFIRYDGAIHGFASFPVPMGKQVLIRVADWLKARLGD
jgi:acetyl esterase